ncbi:hypothetical protein V8G54_021292 [Vigna mungo]|uniref:Uncharacterized protein n=1 Tax=Vigna mungo TaxID=3915 RepID=A0AAQ3NE11_VIGMU
MAVDSSAQREHQIREFVDGNGNVAVGLKLHNKPEMSLVFIALHPVFFPPLQRFHRYCLKILPFQLDCTVHMLARDVYSISVLPEEDESENCASPLAFLSILEVSNQAKSPMCLDSPINCQKCIDFQMKNDDVYSQCSIDIPCVNGNSVFPESYEETVECFKTGNSPTRIKFQRRKTYAESGECQQSKR